MKNRPFNYSWLSIAVCIIFIGINSGCGYTIIRDSNNETQTAENDTLSDTMNLDTLTVGPDLAFANIDYSILPPLPRLSSLDRMGRPYRIEFHIKITNKGNSDFTNPFIIMCENHGRAIFRSFNNLTLTIRDTLSYDQTEDYLYDRSEFTFTILTNSKIQERVINYAHTLTNAKIHVLVGHELNYLNNETSVVPSSYKMLNDLH